MYTNSWKIVNDARVQFVYNNNPRLLFLQDRTVLITGKVHCRWQTNGIMIMKQRWNDRTGQDGGILTFCCPKHSPQERAWDWTQTPAVTWPLCGLSIQMPCIQATEQNSHQNTLLISIRDVLRYYRGKIQSTQLHFHYKNICFHNSLHVST